MGNLRTYNKKSVITSKARIIWIIRFGMFHPNRVHGIVTINNTASASLARFVEKMSEKLKVGKTEAGVKRLNVK